MLFLLFLSTSLFQPLASSCFAFSVAEDKFYLSLGSACLVGTLLLIAFPVGNRSRVRDGWWHGTKRHLLDDLNVTFSYIQVTEILSFRRSPWESERDHAIYICTPRCFFAMNQGNLGQPNNDLLLWYWGLAQLQPERFSSHEFCQSAIQSGHIRNIHGTNMVPASWRFL